MNQSSRKSLWILLCGVLAGILIMLVPGALFSGQNSKTEISSTTLKNSLVSASELTVTKFNYAKVGKFTNSLELNGWTIPFTQKDFLLTYQGVVSLGVLMDQADVQVDETARTIAIQVPGISVLSNQIIEDSIEVYNENTNLFNPIQVSDYLEFAKSQKATALQEVRKHHILNEAKEDAADAITALLNMIPEIHQNYTIEVSFEHEDSYLDENGEVLEDQSENGNDSNDSQSNEDVENGNDSNVNEVSQDSKPSKDNENSESTGSDKNSTDKEQDQ